MMPHAPRTRLLVALLDLAQASEIIDLYSLAEEAGLNLYRTLSEVHALSLAGFVDARRLRLTASGLVVAAALAGSERGAVEAPVAKRTRLDASNVRAANLRMKPDERRLDARRQQTQSTVRELFERDLVA